MPFVARARSRRRSSSATPPFTKPGIPPISRAFEHTGHDHVRDPGADMSFADATSRACACAYLLSTPADGGGPVGGFRVGVTRHHRESTWCGDSDDGVSSRAALVRAA